MRSLTSKVSRPVIPVNPISTKPLIPSEGITNPELKVPTIRNTKSLVVLDKVYLEYLKTKVMSESNQYKSLLISNGIKSKDEANLVINYYKDQVNKLLYGTPPKLKAEYEKNYYERNLAFCGSIVSRISAEQDWDSNPENRFISCFDENLKVKRYDKKPEDKIIFRDNLNNSKKYLIGPEGKKIYPNVLTFFSKSALDTRGKIIPVNNLSLDIFTEFFPNELANFVYKHVADTNKAVIQRGYEFDSDKECTAQDRSNMLSELEQMEKTASSLTSASRNATRPELFMAWGRPGEYIEIDTAKVRILSPSQIVNLILYAANDEHASKPAQNADGSKFKWVEHKKNLWNEKSLKDTEKALIDHGIDPNGDWTEREKTAYYTLIAGEWLVVGATSEHVARIIYASE